MLYVNTALMQDKIIDLLTNFDDADLTFKYVDKQGIKLRFETNATDLEAAAKKVKAAIKAQSWGSVLYFQVGVE